MQSLKWLGYSSWALAALFAVIGISEGIPISLVAALSLAISGILFLAFDQMIFLLTEIRDSLKQSATKEPAPLPRADEPAKPPRSLDEITADLNRLKASRAS